MTLLSLGLYIFLEKIKNSTNRFKKEKKEISEDLCIGFLLCTTNVIMLIVTMFIINYIK